MGSGAPVIALHCSTAPSALAGMGLRAAGGGGGAAFVGVCTRRGCQNQREHRSRSGKGVMGCMQWGGGTCYGRSWDKRFRGVGRGTLQPLLVHQGFFSMYPTPLCISHIRHGFVVTFANHTESWTHLLWVFAHLNPHGSDFGDICAFYSPSLHLLTMQSSPFGPGCPAIFTCSTGDCVDAIMKGPLVFEWKLYFTRGHMQGNVIPNNLKLPEPKPAHKPQPKASSSGEHVQLFPMVYDCKKGF